jgi:lipopolysaccharide/colanic/teichoic acid biosynthesis glycosyltransferase
MAVTGTSGRWHFRFCMEVSPLLIELVNPPVGAPTLSIDSTGPRPSSTRTRKTSEIHTPAPVIPVAPRIWYLRGRAVVEYAAAVALMILAAPVLFLTAILVRLTSRGPAFYTQTRIGRNGKLFTIYKIRTMVHDCESLTGPRWAMPEDPRVTRVGHFLRRTHLDELPQLFNVLRGDMSLIGPRPERPEFVPKLERAVPRYRERLAIRPGITGLAQVHLPPDTDIESVRRKLAYDLYYIQNMSVWLDLRILAATLFYSVGNPLLLSRRMTRTPIDQSQEEPVAIPLPEEATRRKKICA